MSAKGYNLVIVGQPTLSFAKAPNNVFAKLGFGIIYKARGEFCSRRQGDSPYWAIGKKEQDPRHNEHCEGNHRYNCSPLEVAHKAPGAFVGGG
jgi:hypothetical protein